MKSGKTLSLVIVVGACAFLSAGLLKRFNGSAGILLINKGDSYEKLWKRVDSCTDKGLTESAIKIVDVIYDKAKASDNAPQFVKAILYRMKLTAHKEESALEKSIVRLREEAEQARFPAKPVLQSILAESCWQYYVNNRWKFYNRTTTVSFKNDDISTWDLKTIVDASIKNYKASLSNADSLKRTRVDIYDDIIEKGTVECRRWRPTLYDFLAHRALSFFMSSEPDVSRPASRFSVNEEVYLKPYSEFLKASIVNPSDSLETKFYALRLLQDLTRFHEKDQNPDALIDIELQRLDYIHGHSVHPLRDTLYLLTMHDLAKTFPKSGRITEIDYRIASWYHNRSSAYQPLAGDAFRWYRKTAKEICHAVMKKDPNAYGAKQCANLMANIEQKSFNLSLEEVNEPGKPFRALVTSANIQKIYVKIVRSGHLELRRFYRNDWGEKLFDKLKKLPEVMSFSVAIQDEGDFQTHAQEISLPALPYGQYVVLTSLEPDFRYAKNLSSYARLTISDIATMERARDDGSHEFYALHRQTGEPLKHLEVQVWHEKYSYVTREYEMRKGELLKTDEKGFLKIHYQKDEERSYFLEYINGKDSYFGNQGYYSYQRYNDERSRIVSYLFTDRAIYRPGQTIYFKSIVLEGSKKEAYKIKSNYPVTVTFYDVNHQKLSSLDLITNEFGTVSGSFVAPQGLLNGKMFLRDGHGSVYFSVEDYKRPKFETKFNHIQVAFRLNDTVIAGGLARAYAGNPIDGAQVKYRVVRTVNYPYWWHWYRPYHAGGQETEILNGVTQTNDTGGFVIKFKALPDVSVSKKSQASYHYDIYADVTDINGETHSAFTSAVVGYQAIQLSISNEEVISQRQIKPFAISSLNLNGVPEPVKGSFTVHRLRQPEKPFRKRLWPQPDRHSLSKEEYYQTFPNDLYEDELNRYKWPKAEKLLEKDFDTGSKTEYDLSSEFKDLKPGVYVMEAVCKDKFGEEVKAFRYFTLFEPGNEQMPETAPDWFYLSSSQAEPGQKLNYILASASDNTGYLFELEVKDKPAESERRICSMKANEINITEEHRGNVSFHCSFIRFNRFYRHSSVIHVPHTNKELDITFESFRNKLLPGQQEEWKLTVKDKKGDKMVAELMAGMYDASLDAFAPNSWNFNIHRSFYSRLGWNSGAGNATQSTEYNELQTSYVSIPSRYYDQLNYFGMYYHSGRFGKSYYRNGRGSRSRDKAEKMEMEESAAAPAKAAEVLEDRNAGNELSRETAQTIETKKSRTVTGNFEESKESDGLLGDGKDAGSEFSGVKVRSNFNETAFFYPQLKTNANGETVISFTVPESLTKWKVMGLAHTRDLKYGSFQKELITQKDLMVQPNVPRFFREGDKMTLLSKISNLGDKDLKGSAELRLYDALTEKEISTAMLEAVAGPFPSIGYRDFSVKKGLSTVIEWNIAIPAGYSAIKYKIVARAGNFSDGEEMAIPVLTNRMLVTESMPLPVRSNQTKEFSFGKFISQNNNSTTLRNHAYTLEFTANPAWYAVQALPYIMEYPYECSEQTFSRYYANCLATYIVNSKPKLKAVFETWRSQSPAAFLSNLEKNQELKAVVLEETPWVLQAKSETENKRRVGLLFDLNRMSQEQSRAFRKLLKAQTPNGGFCWFEGGPDDWYISQHIACGFGHLDRLGVLKTRNNSETWNMLYKAVKYCDRRMREDYERVKKYDKEYRTKNHLSNTAIHYLYMRSFYKDIEMDAGNKEHFEYYKKQAQTYWLETGRFGQGMIALSLHRYQDLKTPKDILRSLKENALNSEEMGMYWKENYGYYWYEAPVEKQAIMIEAFDEVLNDQKSVDDLKTWLIKSKQTQHWGTTKATTEAVYALLLKGTDWLATEPEVEIKVGDIKLDPKNDPEIKAEPGTGYFKKTWSGSDIKTNMGSIKVQKKDQGVSWGAVYWQYFEQLDKITPHETPLKLKKQLFLLKNSGSGPVMEPLTENSALKLGDKIRVRIELRVDRDMDYVHMKDMRAAGFEPTNVFSGYRWQDGLSYYESTRDAATHFFFSHLPKGSYVFEYPLLVNQYGDFSNGITQIQCMYAPEFASHSEGIRVKVTR